MSELLQQVRSADIETVIVNKNTTSMPLWLQMCGRGGRPHIRSSWHSRLSILEAIPLRMDSGQVRAIGLMFSITPEKKVELRLWDCPKCEALVHARCMECPECGYEFPWAEVSGTNTFRSSWYCQRNGCNGIDRKKYTIQRVIIHFYLISANLQNRHKIRYQNDR